jgi:uncharacterized protein YciI
VHILRVRINLSKEQDVAERTEAERQARFQQLIGGFLHKEMYVVVTRPVQSPEIAPMLLEHLENQVKLEKEGIMFAAGPLFDEGSDKPVAGMFVIRAASFDEAKAIADADPLHKAGLRSYTLRKWQVNEGQFQVRINFSDQTAEIG